LTPIVLISEALLQRRILNHTAPKSNVLHRHYVGLSTGDVAGALVGIQVVLAEANRRCLLERLSALKFRTLYFFALRKGVRIK
jgi:hypothetical protein